MIAKLLNVSSLNLWQHSANAVLVQSRFFLMISKFCCQDNFDITLVKMIVAQTNGFTLFQALSCEHSRSLVMWFIAFEKIQHRIIKCDSSPNHLWCYKPCIVVLNNWWESSLFNFTASVLTCVVFISVIFFTGKN